MAQIDATNETTADTETATPMAKKRRVKAEGSEAASTKAAPVSSTGKSTAKAGGRGLSKTISVKVGAGSESQVVVVKAAKKSARKETKASIVLKKLNSARGVTIAAVMEETGWQTHSVRGFFSAVVRKKLSLNLVSETGKDGERRYRIVAPEGQGT